MGLTREDLENDVLRKSYEHTAHGLPLVPAAEFERSLILERTAEGRARAVAAGRRMGRKPLITGAQHQEALRLAADNRTHLEISRILRVSRSTVSRFLARNPQD